MAAPKLTADTVALLDGTERVSAAYFKDIRNRMKKDPIAVYVRKLDFSKPFNSQILRIIAENYVLWKEAKRLGFHHRRKYKMRFVTSLQGYFAEYVSSGLVNEGILKPHDKFNREKINKFLLDYYKVRITIRNVDFSKVFNTKRKSPSLELYKPLPKAEYTPYQRFNKKEAEKHEAVSYRIPDEIRGIAKKGRVKLNLRQILSKLRDYDFYKFKSAKTLYRREMIQSMIAGDLIALEFKRRSQDDKTTEEYVRRVEQVSLARWYRMLRGIDAASNYSLGPDELALEPISLTRANMRAYFEKHKKKKFSRPRAAEVWIIRLTRQEVEEGDEFLELMKEPEDDYTILDRRIYDQQDALGQKVAERNAVRKRVNGSAPGPKKTKMQKRLTVLEKEVTEISAKVKKMKDRLETIAVDVPKKKLIMFERMMAKLNKRENRTSGEMRKSSYLGKIEFKAGATRKRYENIAFTVPNHPFNGKESILFNSGEGDYVILYVKQDERRIPPFDDPMVQTRIRYNLELHMRKKAVRDFVNSRMKEVLNKKNVNWKVLKKI